MKMKLMSFTLALSLMALCGCDFWKEKPKAIVWQGYVEGEYVYVAAPIGGQLMKLSAQRGDLIKEGDALFALDSREEAAQLSSAEFLLAQGQATLDDMRKGKRPEEIAALNEILHQSKAAKDLAEIEFAREERLLKASATPVKDYDSANYTLMASIAKLAETSANLKVAELGSREDQIRAWSAYCESLKANIDALKWRLGQKTQAAPKGGRVFDTFHREGEYVAAASPVAAILPPGNVKLRFFIAEPQVSMLKTGMNVRYSFTSSNAPKEATISYISPEVEFTPPVIYSRESRSKLVFMVEARPEAADAPNLNVGVPLDVFLTARGAK